MEAPPAPPSPGHRGGLSGPKEATHHSDSEPEPPAVPGGPALFLRGRATPTHDSVSPTGGRLNIWTYVPAEVLVPICSAGMSMKGHLWVHQRDGAEPRVNTDPAGGSRNLPGDTCWTSLRHSGPGSVQPGTSSAALGEVPQLLSGEPSLTQRGLWDL